MLLGTSQAIQSISLRHSLILSAKAAITADTVFAIVSKGSSTTE